MHMGSEIYVLAGPNGAGKSSSAPLLLPKRLGVDQFVNADLIAAGLSPFAPQASAWEAGRLMLLRIRELHNRGVSFAFETTLATRSYVSFLGDAQGDGYLVHVIFVWLEGADLALTRIGQRVREGGHDVPPEVVRRRYRRGLRNFFDLYQPMADSWSLCDNSGESLIVIAQGGMDERVLVHDERRYDRIRREYADAAE